jgi:hypothetical protein
LSGRSGLVFRGCDQVFKVGLGKKAALERQALMNGGLGQYAQEVVPSGLQDVRGSRQRQKSFEVIAMTFGRFPADEKLFLAPLWIRQGGQNGMNAVKPEA